MIVSHISTSSMTELPTFFMITYSGSAGKDSTCNAGDPGLIPGLGRSFREGNGNPLPILAWRTPWTEEPGSCSPGDHERVGYDLGTEQQML